jgi:hypothetical protein
MKRNARRRASSHRAASVAQSGGSLASILVAAGPSRPASPFLTAVRCRVARRSSVAGLLCFASTAPRGRRAPARSRVAAVLRHRGARREAELLFSGGSMATTRRRGTRTTTDATSPPSPPSACLVDDRFFLICKGHRFGRGDTRFGTRWRRPWLRHPLPCSDRPLQLSPPSSSSRFSQPPPPGSCTRCCRPTPPASITVGMVRSSAVG